MKQANNTEMDRLLQRHARRWNAAISSGESAGGDGASTNEARAHLDADEMNAYAEGALPPAARARYASHLADCRSCRVNVTSLTLAAQTVADESRRAAPESASPSKSWWSAIAALFAPPVLRFAVPAALLLGVIIVALVATRDRSEPQFVAQNEEKQADGVVSKQAAPEASPAQVPPGESAGEANTSATTTEPTKADATTNASPSEGMLQANANAGRATSAPTTETKPAPTSAADSSPRGEESAVNDELYATEPKDAPPPPVASRPASPSAGKVEEERQDRQQNAATTSSRTETADLGRSNSSKEDDAKDKSSAAGESAAQQTGASQAGAGARTRRAAKSVANKGADDNDRSGYSTETRSVAGRQFRRQGDAWIDTAYHSSRSTINVARGSDQYRALAADEPGLRSIAEQLGGEVIVVWKGKAYRIH
jgi:hypothetical protein